MNKRFTDEFKIQAVKQVTAEGYSVASAAERLGVSTTGLSSLVITVHNSLLRVSRMLVLES
ncbi:transposase [Vibrio celticus]|uniref:transposase n=1 Tax=Vibrio celticus TaxID=446372 RepID=UPI0040694D8E